MDSSKMSPELRTLKDRLRAMWMSGDFGQIALAIKDGAVQFADRLQLKPGMRVLDVACGTGNLAIPAARTGAKVTGIDIAPNLIEQAKANAADEGLEIQFDVGDAEAMPYDDASFDVVMTMFGAMFAPRPDVTASELTRVCRPGGVVAMANWTPTGFTGQMFKTGSKHVPPPAGMPSPVLWGDDETVRRRLSEGVSEVRTAVRPIDMTFPFGPVQVVEFFRRFFGPTNKAFESLDADGQEALRKDLEDLWAGNNAATDGTTRAPSDYLEVIAIKS